MKWVPQILAVSDRRIDKSHGTGSLFLEGEQ
jgi:hypothetical protein